MSLCYVILFKISLSMERTRWGRYCGKTTTRIFQRAKLVGGTNNNSQK